MRKLACAAMAFVVAVPFMTPTRASSHREAPLISQDPLADNTDVYAFVSPERPDRVVLISNFIPLQFPSSGPNFWKFDDNVLYEVMIDNTGDAVEDITYQWQFRTEIRNPNTFLYNTGPVSSIDDPDLNVRQFYNLTRVVGPRRTGSPPHCSPPISTSFLRTSASALSATTTASLDRECTLSCRTICAYSPDPVTRRSMWTSARRSICCSFARS